MRIQSLTVLMLGEEDSPFLKLKAAKSRRIKAEHKKGGVVIKERRVDKWPNLKIGDRIEPAAEGYPDFWHGESVETYPPEKRRFLIYRRHKNGLLNMSRLIEIPGISRGIPGVKLEHFIYDSMHVMELG
eukprot:609410-Pyramimonas_sp.AAC.1